MNFYVKQLPSGRVYLSQIEPTESEVVLEVIDAETWLDARFKTAPNGFEKYTPRKDYGFVQ